MSVTETSTADDARVTRRDLVDGNAEKVVTERTGTVPISHGGGVDYSSLRDMVDTAKLLSAAGPMLPPWLQGNVGGMFGIVMRAQELGIAPLTLANWTYVVEQGGVQRVAYESQFYHSIIEARAPIKGRLQARYEGEGGNRKCFVFATFKGETEPRVWPPADSADQFTLDKLKPGKNQYGKTKGSPLWDTKPDIQLFYNMSRDWARVYCPDILGGVYGKDELEEVGFTAASDVAIDVSPKLRERLGGATSEGFQHEKALQSIDAALDAARPAEPTSSKKHKRSAGETGDGPEVGDESTGSSGAAASEGNGNVSDAVAAAVLGSNAKVAEADVAPGKDREAE
jgi:hypothetical protein